jgi:diacylglycerol O-acyltransferase / wax synthase
MQAAASSDVGEVADAALSQPLARDRPLWEMRIVGDAAGDGFTLVGKAHHLHGRRVGGGRTGNALLDPTPDASPEARAAWEPESAPSAVALMAQAVRDRVSEQLSVARAAYGLVRSPRRLREAPGAITRVGRARAHSIVPLAPPSPLNRASSPARHLAMLRRPLDDLRQIKRHHHTTVNDVLLATVAGGLRGFLAERGEEPVALKTMVPVSVRGDAGDGELGNRISFLFTELPCAETEPLVRLMEINKVTAQRKAADEPAGSDAALQALGHAPRMLQHATSRLVASPARVQSRRLEHPGTARAAVHARLRAQGGLSGRAPGGRPRARDRHDHGPTHRVLGPVRRPEDAARRGPARRTHRQRDRRVAQPQPMSRAGAPLSRPDQCPRVSPREG